ncbi:MAG: YdbL family protein [Gammaproteobacteria bacterium]|nr:YdbL family protein [Gammaproteobacteria bacterium]MDT8371731.1 YdbL family protein [Gammaproteobacteria bacterium]
MKLIKWLTSSVAGLMLVSCVTINIYFPAAAAEKAADRIIEDVWGPETAPAGSSSDQNKDSQKDSAIQKHNYPVAMQVLDWLVSPAAAEANLNINSPAVATLQSQMKARHDSLKAYYESGAVGLTEDGLVTVRDAKAIALKDRNTVKGLVAAENADRNALYAEIARANGHPEWKADIQATFSRRWISNAASGWWYQSAGSWQQK